MSEQIDLRKYHINDNDDAENFLDFVEARLPELRKIFGKHKLKIASLESRAEFAEQQAGNVASANTSDVSSVGDRMTGSGGAKFTPSVAAPETSRLAQLRSAGTVDPAIAKAAEAIDTSVTDPLNLPPAPGEIGVLDIDNKPTDLSATLGGADPITAASQAPGASFGVNGQPVVPTPTVSDDEAMAIAQRDADVKLASEAAGQQVAQALQDAIGDTTLTEPITVTRTQTSEQAVDLMAMAQNDDETEQVTSKPATGQVTSGNVLSDQAAKK